MSELAIDLLGIAAEAARSAGHLVRERLADGPARVVTKATPTDMVTEVDGEAELLVVEHILRHRPHDGISGEESGDRPGTSGVHWYVDPLDGTTNFLYRFPAMAVSVGAKVHGEAMAGAIYDIVSGQMATTARGHGAFIDGKRIHVTAKDELATALIGTGFSYDAGERALQAEVLRAVLPRVRDIRRAGAAALDLVSVACGRLDGYYESGLQPWDHAAGLLLVEEAGGRHAQLTFGHDGPQVLVAAGPGLIDALVALLEEAGARLPQPA
jgi:fructose-1,6-bisphosphatase/inositol monophosphatase family enzyme